MITYKRRWEIIDVYLEKKRIGAIKQVTGGYQYFPKGKRKGGEIFKSVMQCMVSLEG
jgi:hypothetical protein